MTDEITKSPTPIRVGQEIKGKVTRVELYGAFVDIGSDHDALLHISQLGRPDVRNVEDVLKVGDDITAYVLKVYQETGRIALTTEKPPETGWDDIQVGDIITGQVVRIENFGVFVDVGAERPGMVHVSELDAGFVKSPADVVSIGDQVEVRVIKVNRKKKQIDLSMKLSTKVEEVVPEDVEEMPTAMALALQRAMSSDNRDEDEPSPRNKNKNVGKNQREREDILSRTLREHLSN